MPTSSEGDRLKKRGREMDGRTDRRIAASLYAPTVGWGHKKRTSTGRGRYFRQVTRRSNKRYYIAKGSFHTGSGMLRRGTVLHRTVPRCAVWRHIRCERTLRRHEKSSCSK